MSNHVAIRDFKRGGARSAPKPRLRSKRARTFSTEQAANAYAKANSIANYTLRNLALTESRQKKIRIEVKS